MTGLFGEYLRYNYNRDFFLHLWGQGMMIDFKSLSPTRQVVLGAGLVSYVVVGVIAIIAIISEGNARDMSLPKEIISIGILMVASLGLISQGKSTLAFFLSLVSSCFFCVHFFQHHLGTVSPLWNIVIITSWLIWVAMFLATVPEYKPPENDLASFDQNLDRRGTRPHQEPNFWDDQIRRF